MIQIPQSSPINEKKITVAIPKRLRIRSWDMNSVKKRSKPDQNLVDDDYDMFNFRAFKKLTNHYIFQTSTENLDALKSEAVILISQ